MDQLHTVGFGPDQHARVVSCVRRNEAGQDVPNIWLVPVTSGAPPIYQQRDASRPVVDGRQAAGVSALHVGQSAVRGRSRTARARSGIVHDEPGRHCHMVAW